MGGRGGGGVWGCQAAQFQLNKHAAGIPVHAGSQSELGGEVWQESYLTGNTVCKTRFFTLVFHHFGMSASVSSLLLCHCLYASTCTSVTQCRNGTQCRNALHGNLFGRLLLL